MAKKTAARTRAPKKQASRKARARRAAPLPPGAVRADIVLDERHVRLLEALGRAYALERPGDLAAVVREVLDRYGHRLLRLAMPRRTVDEEE